MEKGEIVEIVNAFSYVGIVFTDRQTYSLYIQYIVSTQIV